jgi:hypothetical protein
MAGNHWGFAGRFTRILKLAKKERLYAKTNSFLAEVDRDRTRFEQFSKLVIALALLGGEAAQEFEPARKLINSIARLLGRSKEFEDSICTRVECYRREFLQRLRPPRRHKPPPHSTSSPLCSRSITASIVSVGQTL